MLEREHHSALNIEDGSSVGSWQQEQNSDEWGKWSHTNTVASSQMNFDLLFGADYYFNDAIYVGFEAGLRYATSLGVTSTITTDTPNPSTSTSTVDPEAEMLEIWWSTRLLAKVDTLGAATQR